MAKTTLDRSDLTRTKIAAIRPADRQFRVYDGKTTQLYLRVLPSGVKTWCVVWGRNRDMALGKWPGVTVEAARERAHAVLVEVAQNGKPLSVIEAEKPAAEKPMTFGDFIGTHYAAWALAHQKAGKATVDSIKSTFGGLYKKPLRELCGFDVERVKAKRLKDGLKVSTVNRDLDRIRGALSRALEWGMLDAHPLKSVKRAKGEDHSRVRYLSPDEESRMRTALATREADRRKSRESGNEWCEVRGGDGRPMWPADGFTDHLMPMVLVAINTGCRRGELFGLAWDHVDLIAKRLTVIAGNAKSRRARHVPLNAEALDTLTRWKRQGSGVGLVFPGTKGRMTNINRSWAGLVEAADLVDFRFHDCRHHFASRLVQNGVDLYTVKELLGHADFAMTQRYAHLAPDHLAAAVAKLGAL